jgi:hypothetical protein
VRAYRQHDLMKSHPLEHPVFKKAKKALKSGARSAPLQGARPAKRPRKKS